MHVCDYSLTVDMGVEPVSGCVAACFDTGFGDLGVWPDMATLLRILWLEGTALNCVDEAGIKLTQSRRANLKRRIVGARDAGLDIKMGSELEFFN